MKKQSPSQSAFLNLRVLFGTALLLCGVGLAVAGLNTYTTDASPPSTQATSPPAAPARGAVDFSAADKDGRFVYLIEFADKGLLHRQTLARGEHFNPNTPQALTQRAEITREQANHVQGMTSALGRQLQVSHHF